MIDTAQYAGTTSGTRQDVTMTYDGHGRMKTRHYPIENSGAATTWNYNADDAVSQIVDPRGAITNFTYGDPRGLTTQISYSVPDGSTIPVTPMVNFSYDNLGNRTLMTDGTGTHAYAYDALSRLTSETKTFTGLTGNFTITYGYQISGKLKSITDPFGAVVNYNDDLTGRTTAVTGSNFLDVTNYATNIKFRAFGGVKEMSYGSGDNSVVSFGFDNALRINSYQSTSSVLAGGFVRKANYEYNQDGSTKKVNNLVDSKFEQNYVYDHAGRLKSSESGMTTNAQSQQVRTYSQTLQYNAFDEITSRGTGLWGASDGFTAAYINGRKQGSNEIYDAAGNIVEKPTSSTVYDRWKFDAAGRLVETVSRWYQGRPQQTSFDRTLTISQPKDGDGKTVKRVENQVSMQIFPPSTYVSETSEYYVRSSVLGGKVLTELNADGAKTLTNVYAGKGVLAEQRVSPATPGPPPVAESREVFWKHEDIVTGSYSKMIRNGTVQGANDPPSSSEFEPLGGIIPNFDPAPIEPDPSPAPGSYQWGGNVERPEFGCAIDGLPLPCNLLSTLVRGFNIREIHVNTRVEGGLDLYHGLRNGGFLRRTDVYTNDEGNDTTEDDGDVIKVKGATRYLYSFYELLISATQQQTQSVPISDKNQKRIAKALSNLETLKPSEKCQKNVIDKLAASFGFSLNDFQSFLKKGGEFYDGEKSKVTIAGNVYTKQAGDSKYGKGATVSGVFNKTSNGTQLNGLTSVNSSTLKIYYRQSAITGDEKEDGSLLFHEALHGYGGSLGGTSYFDDEIQEAFFGKGSKEVGKASSNIKAYIKKYCF